MTQTAAGILGICHFKTECKDPMYWHICFLSQLLHSLVGFGLIWIFSLADADRAMSILSSLFCGLLCLTIFNIKHAPHLYALLSRRQNIVNYTEKAKGENCPLEKAASYTTSYVRSSYYTEATSYLFYK